LSQASFLSVSRKNIIPSGKAAAFASATILYTAKINMQTIGILN
jgi:hypothetical protein